ncbi:hypothetical protein [Halovenus sp. HT40]
MVWVHPDWESIEKCRDCWLDEKLDEVAEECNDRYGRGHPRLKPSF